MEKKIKNTLDIILQTTNTRVTFCYGEKAYNKFIKKQFDVNEYIEKGGVCTSWRHNEVYSIIVGVKKYKDVYSLKALIVHELSHAVTMYFNEHGFNCDELRSYTLQFMYQEIMPFLDNIIQKQNIKRENKQNKAQEVKDEQ